jgi:hypothetical protein
VHPAPSQTESPFSSKSVTSVHNISELDDNGGGDSVIEDSNGSSDNGGDGEDDNNNTDYLPYHKDSTKVPKDADKDSTLPAELCLPPSPFNSVMYFADECPYLVRVNGSYMWHDEHHRCTHKNETTATESSLVDSTCCVLLFFDGIYKMNKIRDSYLPCIAMAHSLQVEIGGLLQRWSQLTISFVNYQNFKKGHPNHQTDN